MSDVPADQELLLIEQQPKGFNPLAYTPAEALTKAEYDRLMAA